MAVQESREGLALIFITTRDPIWKEGLLNLYWDADIMKGGMIVILSTGLDGQGGRARNIPLAQHTKKEVEFPENGGLFLSRLAKRGGEIVRIKRREKKSVSFLPTTFE